LSIQAAQSRPRHRSARRWAAVAGLIVLVTATTAPIWADDTVADLESRRDALRDEAAATASELDLLAAEDAEVAAAVAERFPSFNLTAVFGSGRLDYTSIISETFWSLMVDAVQPIFDNGRRRAEVERSKAVVEEELARYHQTVLSAVQEVEDALASYRSGLEQLKLLEERHIATTATLRLAEDQYFEGLTEYLSVLTNQVAHFNVQRQLLSSRRQLISDRISLLRALGGNWMTDDINQHYQENGEKK